MLELEALQRRVPQLSDSQLNALLTLLRWGDRGLSSKPMMSCSQIANVAMSVKLATWRRGVITPASTDTLTKQQASYRPHGAYPLENSPAQRQFARLNLTRTAIVDDDPHIDGRGRPC